MRRIILACAISVAITIAIMVVYFYHAMLNATVYMYRSNLTGEINCDIDLGWERFNYWEYCENDYRVKRGE